MHDFLFHYERVPPTTWAYLSSLLLIALYFKFARLWSVRNLDLVGLVLLSPGLLLVTYGEARVLPDVAQIGHLWLLGASGLFLFRLLVDPLLVRRPLLEPNLSVGGLTFLGAALLVFLMTNVLTSDVTREDLAHVQRAGELASRQEAPPESDSFRSAGPGFHFLFLLPSISTQAFLADEAPAIESEDSANRDRQLVQQAVARMMAILSHLAVVIGIVMIGYQHFDNIRTGIAAATLYLLVPYTALLTGNVRHALPAALLVWAVAAYRRPLIAGMMMGLAIGSIWYPAFLLPLWISFYWQRGLGRFLVGAALMLAVLSGTLAFNSTDLAMFLDKLKQMYGLRMPVFDGMSGFWGYQGINSVYRLPVIAAFAAMCAGLSLWPAQKNLGTLISCSAAVMLGTQFWNAHGGGLYVGWYLPLLLLTVFRPNLEDRVALSVLGEGWLDRRVAPTATPRAA